MKKKWTMSIGIIVMMAISTTYLFCENVDLHQKNKKYIERLEKIVPSGDETVTIKFSADCLGDPNGELFGKYLTIYHPFNNVTEQIENLLTLEVLNP